MMINLIIFLLLLLLLCTCLCISHDEVVPFFEVIEKNTEVANTVLDYSISQTTLEEVFLNVSQSLVVHS